MLEDLDIIQFEAWKKMWAFKDRKHIIPHARRERCYENGQYRNEVLKPSRSKELFYEMLQDYKGTMPLPTRLIAQKYRSLNDITFLDFLNENINPTPEFVRQLDYHMMDDWGGRTHEVSALAGIHYFTCRPYADKPVDLFSPPQGNAYFAEKILHQLPKNRVNTSHLVANIEKTSSGFEVFVLDVLQKKRKRIRASKVVYAGQKHALKYIYPKEVDLFAMEQAPWMVMNFFTDQREGEYGFWQNECIGDNPGLSGALLTAVFRTGIASVASGC